MRLVPHQYCMNGQMSTGTECSSLQRTPALAPHADVHFKQRQLCLDHTKSINKGYDVLVRPSQTATDTMAVCYSNVPL